MGGNLFPISTGSLQLEINLNNDRIDYSISPMIVTGGELSEGTAGTFTVAALTCLLRSTNSAIGELIYLTLAEQANQAITAADTVYYVSLNYNDGITPTITLSLTDPYLTDKRNIPIGIVMKDGSNVVHFLASGFDLQDGVQKLHERALLLRNNELANGSVIAYSGTNNFTMTVGVSYSGINKISLAAYNSAAVTFIPVYRDGGGGYTEGTPRNTIDYNHYDDNSGSPAGNITVNQYSVHWVFRHTSHGLIYVVYGIDSYFLAQAEAASVPLHPDHLESFGVLIGKIIAPQAGGSFAGVQMVTDTTFTGTATAVHNELGGLQGGPTTYYHLTAAIFGGTVLNKIDATVAPDADNDVTEGYSPGSFWIDVTADKSYVCLDATDGAAVWSEGGGGGSKGITFLLRGDAYTGTKLTQVLIPAAATIAKVKIYSDTQPTGSSIIVDVNKNGTTIFTTQANRPEIAVSTNADDSGAPDVDTLAEGDRLSVDVDQIGSTIVGGADLMITVVFA